MLLLKIRRFCRAQGLTPTRFGRLAVRDPRLVGDLANGRRPGKAMTRRLERFMAEYRA